MCVQELNGQIENTKHHTPNMLLHQCVPNHRPMNREVLVNPMLQVVSLLI
jgi:hypothetical protein